MPVPFQVEKIGRNVHVVKLHSDSGKPRDYWFLLRADVHHDSLLCDRDLERKHLDLAKKRNAGVLTFGDLFDAMGGKFDRRRDNTQIRPEHQSTNAYLTELYTTAAQYYAPYTENMLLFGYGNHEISIIDHHGTDLLQGLTALLNAQGGNVSTGGISGYVKFVFSRGKGQKAHSTSKLLWYHHGGTPGGPVSKGVPAASKRAAYVSDADIIVSGHDHNEWIVPSARIRLSGSGKIEQTRQVHVKVPGYKNSFHDGADGWENLREMPPKTRGACWLKFHCENDKVEMELTLTMDD